MTEVYIFKVAPEYTHASYATCTDLITMGEWCGRTLEDFAAGMAEKRGYKYHVETYALPDGRTIAEHYWVR